MVEAYVLVAVEPGQEREVFDSLSSVNGVESLNEIYGEWDIILKLTGGGSGIGNPAERDPQAVHWDVVNGLASVEKARETYKVAIDPATFQILEDETRKLRSQKKH